MAVIVADAAVTAQIYPVQIEHSHQAGIEHRFARLKILAAANQAFQPMSWALQLRGFLLS